MKIKAAVTTKKDAPFEIREVELAEPKDHEILVKITACGVCHTDDAARVQMIPVPLPAVLGHEGCGVVEEVGPGVTDFNPGDKDGISTKDLEPAKTNWARPIDTPPYYGYYLRPGVTFSYLSLALNEKAQVLKEDGTPFRNIFAAGELTSGNVLGQGYMAGFGMTIGTVFGRLAGQEAVCLK